MHIWLSHCPAFGSKRDTRDTPIIDTSAQRPHHHRPSELLDHRYENKCLDPSNLCSDYGAAGLESCPSSLCSDRRIKAFLECEPKSRRYLLITIVETAGCGVVGSAILYYLARKCWLKKHETIVATCKEIWRSSSSRVFINRASTTVAVKSISNDMKSDHRLVKEFLAEIRTLGTIRHYNIVKLFCCISGKELRLLVYQYFENKSLDQWHQAWRHRNSISCGWNFRVHCSIRSIMRKYFSNERVHSPLPVMQLFRQKFSCHPTLPARE